MYDVIVVGGGPIGAACARALAETGRAVLLLDPAGSRGQAWQAAAGMLAPQIETHQDDPLLELAVSSRALYGELAPSLQETTGLDIGLWQEGIAWIAATDAEVGEVKARVAWQRQQSLVSDWLDADEVAARWPWLAPAAGALWAPHDGAVDPVKLVEALLADATRAGATLIRDSAVSVDRLHDRVAGVTGAAARYAAGDVVLAAGAWSAEIAGVPRPVSVAPVRGEMAALPWPAGIPPGIVYGHGGYVVARGDEAIVGSTMEYAGFQPTVTSPGLSRLFAGITALAPTLRQADVRRTWAGLRPMTPDGLPIIGGEPRLPGLWYATGHGRNGVLLAPITGAVIGQLIAGETPAEDLEAFSPARFWQW